MGFNYNKRIKLGKGFGLHISKSGITPSYRTKRGSLSSKGYSIKTGIPGLIFKRNCKKPGMSINLNKGTFNIDNSKPSVPSVNLTRQLTIPYW